MHPDGAVNRIEARWPSVAAILFFLTLVLLIRPWSELPINDDWQYAHMAKRFAERGTFTTDVKVAPTVVGQSLLALPIIKAFGFSHLHLRLLTLVLAAGILLELDYLLLLGGATAGVRFIALASVAANPIFLHLSMSFMTETYGYFVAFLAACFWFRGRKSDSSSLSVLAGVLAGFAFWIRQYCALVLPALIVAEWAVNGMSIKAARVVLARRALVVSIWFLIVAGYFGWARMTGNLAHFSEPLARVFVPDPVALLLEGGIFLLYLVVFLSPFLLGYGIPRKPTLIGGIFLSAATFAATFAWVGGARNNAPSSFLSYSFPFLTNVFSNHGVGPVTITDVYWAEVSTSPRVAVLPWVVLEVLSIPLTLAWSAFAARLRKHRSEIGVFGVCFALLSLLVVVLSYRYDLFDRYHYPGILGLTIAVAVLFPRDKWRILRVAGFIWVSAMATYSTLALHDYFRWQEVRADLLSYAQHQGIPQSQIDGGFEPNGWGTLEGKGFSSSCGFEVAWFCRERQYRIGIEKRPTEILIAKKSVDTWLSPFPDVLLLKRL